MSLWVIDEYELFCRAIECLKHRSKIESNPKETLRFGETNVIANITPFTYNRSDNIYFTIEDTPILIRDHSIYKYEDMYSKLIEILVKRRMGL
jgi:hypothetical protein